MYGLAMTGIPSLANSGRSRGKLLDLLDAFDHNLLARLQALGDDPVRADAISHLDRAKHCLVVRREHNDLVLRLHFDHCRLRNQQAFLFIAGLDPNPSEATGAKNGVWVGKLGGHLDGAGLGADLAIHVDDDALLGIGLVVGLDVFDRRVAAARPG